MIFMLAVLFDKCQMWNIFRISSYFFIIKSREGRKKRSYHVRSLVKSELCKDKHVNGSRSPTRLLFLVLCSQVTDSNEIVSFGVVMETL